jgi:hypothetical protein
LNQLANVGAFSRNYLSKYERFFFLPLLPNISALIILSFSAALSSLDPTGGLVIYVFPKRLQAPSSSDLLVIDNALELEYISEPFFDGPTQWIP